jgi:hypothetical protein
MYVYQSIILQALLLDGRHLWLSLVNLQVTYQQVYYHLYFDTYPSASNEEQGWWVGVSTHVGDELTYKILTQKQWALYQSAICSAMDPAMWNRRLSPLVGETILEIWVPCTSNTLASDGSQ